MENEIWEAFLRDSAAQERFKDLFRDLQNPDWVVDATKSGSMERLRRSTGEPWPEAEVRAAINRAYQRGAEHGARRMLDVVFGPELDTEQWGGPALPPELDY